MKRAIMEFTIGVQGGETLLYKVDGNWSILKSGLTWIR